MAPDAPSGAQQAPRPHAARLRRRAPSGAARTLAWITALLCMAGSGSTSAAPLQQARLAEARSAPCATLRSRTTTLLAQAAEAAPAAPPNAAVTRPASAPDVWEFNGTSAGGWQAGDRIRFERAGQGIGEGVVIRAAREGGELIVQGRLQQGLRGGDQVIFVRHRKPLPAASSPTAAREPARPPRGSSREGRSDSDSAAQSDFREVGAISGLAGTDWWQRDTATCRVFARKGNLDQVRAIVDGLDASATFNTRFMGLPTPPRMTFYMCPLETPGHAQPRFQQLLANRTRAAGVAISKLNSVVINLGDWRSGYYLEPWDVEVTCRHEMNHLFAYQVRGADRSNTWGWLYEALAHTAEDTVRPGSAQMDMAAMKAYMAGYRSADASFVSLIGDRNNDSLEQYRDYSKLLMSIIYYLQDRYGSDVVARLMRSASGQDIEDAFIAVVGRNIREIEAEWRAYYH